LISLATRYHNKNHQYGEFAEYCTERDVSTLCGDLPYVILELGDQAGVPGVAELYQNLKGGKGHLMDVHHRILRQREVKVS